MSDADTTVLIERDGPLAVLTLNRPDKLNAIDADMFVALREATRQLDRDAGVRAVVLTGAGERAFCAGGDIKDWSGFSADDFGRFWVREGHETFDALARLRQPVIAVLNGAALGGGLELAAVADYRIAEQHVRVGQPETGIGVIPGWSGTQRAVRRFGSQLVRRMAMFGEVFEADEARGLGLVDRVVPSGAGLAEAHKLATAVLSRGPRAVELTKALINVAEGEESERTIEAMAGTIAAGSDELAEGVAAFREKRKPDFGS